MPGRSMIATILLPDPSSPSLAPRVLLVSSQRLRHRVLYFKNKKRSYNLVAEGGVCVGEAAQSIVLVGAHRRSVLQGLGCGEGAGPLLGAPPFSLPAFRPGRVPQGGPRPFAMARVMFTGPVGDLGSQVER